MNIIKIQGQWKSISVYYEWTRQEQQVGSESMGQFKEDSSFPLQQQQGRTVTKELFH